VVTGRHKRRETDNQSLKHRHRAASYLASAIKRA
jgi:hypothetical protein